MTRFTHRIRFAIAGIALAALPTVAAAGPFYTGPSEAEREAALLKRFDSNHDGVISTAERRRAGMSHDRSMLERFDVNGNGKLGPAEAAAARAQRIASIIDRLDRNRDGRLSFAEVRVEGMYSALVMKFRLIDANHNRLLSKQELIESPYVKTPVVHPRAWWTHWNPA